MDKYMHTLNGRLAIYDKGEQVRFAGNGDSLNDLLVDSWVEIRKQWMKSEEWRTRQGFGDAIYNHGYIRVKLPAPKESE